MYSISRRNTPTGTVVVPKSSSRCVVVVVVYSHTAFNTTSLLSSVVIGRRASSSSSSSSIDVVVVFQSEHKNTRERERPFLAADCVGVLLRDDDDDDTKDFVVGVGVGVVFVFFVFRGVDVEREDRTRGNEEYYSARIASSTFVFCSPLSKKRSKIVVLEVSLTV